MTTPSLPDVTSAYIKIRDALDAKRKEATRDQAELKEKLGQLEGFLKDQLQNVLKVESIKTPYGTVFTTTKTSVGVQDWDAVLAYIKSNDAYNLLNRSVNKTAVGEYVKEHSTPPPGVKSDSFLEVAVRRPTAAQKKKES